MRNPSKLFAILLLAISAFASGCSSSIRATHENWRESLEQQASSRSGGDLSFLREPPANSPHRQFSVISANSPEKSRDIVGVLVGTQMIDQQPWHVWLVADVNKREIKDMRLALVHAAADGFDWRWGVPDQQAMQQYVSHKSSASSAYAGSSASLQSTPSRIVSFPAERDEFELALIGDMITVTERNTGARWEMTLTDRRGPASQRG